MAFTMQTEDSFKQRSEGRKKGIPRGIERPLCEKCPGNKQQIIKLTRTQNRLGDRDGGNTYLESLFCACYTVGKTRLQAVYVVFKLAAAGEKKTCEYLSRSHPDPLKLLLFFFQEESTQFCN